MHQTQLHGHLNLPVGNSVITMTANRKANKNQSPTAIGFGMDDFVTTHCIESPICIATWHKGIEMIWKLAIGLWETDCMIDNCTLANNYDQHQAVFHLPSCLEATSCCFIGIISICIHRSIFMGIQAGT